VNGGNGEVKVLIQNIASIDAVQNKHPFLLEQLYENY